MVDPRRLGRMQDAERWIAWVRLGAVVFALLEVGVLTETFPAGYEQGAWATTGVFAAGAIALFVLSRVEGARWILPVGVVALAFDTAVTCAYATIFSYEYGSPTRWTLIFVVVEGALRYGLAGGIVVPLALVPFFWFSEWWRADRFGPPRFLADRVTFPAGVALVTGLIVGWLVERLEREARHGIERAAEAERLRDELGRRVDALEAANRCARALASSLVLEASFTAFLRELRGLVPFDRVSIVLVEGGRARVMAAAGIGTDEVFPAGSEWPLDETVAGDVLRGEVVLVGRLEDDPKLDAEQLVALGLHSRLSAPLLVGARSVGMLSLTRRERDAFTPGEVELVSLLGRLVATAVQNIRAYEAERQTVEELRRLSTLRADFVSLVSHELRSPMAAVIGAARTLEQRWRSLTPEQREAFLALIADETGRLAALIGDVLDTSRIDAGTFSYSFGDVDVGALVHDTVAAIAVGTDEVRLRADVRAPLPLVRGDRERLRQVLQNLLDNAVKYSPSGDEVQIVASAENGNVRVEVTDHGPGIPADQQRLIFEKFGRAEIPGSKPGTGLGLFIARSIAEAHGGTVDVRSRPTAGTTFTLTLPVSESSAQKLEPE